MANVTAYFQAGATIGDLSENIRYADTKREWTSGGFMVQAGATIGDLSDNIKYGDIKRIWTAGGAFFQAGATIGDLSENLSYADIKRMWVAGGAMFQAAATIGDLSSDIVQGDVLRIAFVTLTPQTDRNAILLQVTMPRGAIPFMLGETTHLAWCWKLAREDGTVMGFTSHDEDIAYQGVTYKASTGFAPTAVSTSSDMSVDNLDAEGFISDESITVTDLRNGKYNNAEIEVFLCDYTDLNQGVFILRRGHLGEVTYGDNKFTAEIRGLMENFSQKSGKVTSRVCRTSLGSTLCKIHTSEYTASGTVTAIDNDGFYIDVTQDEDYYTYGLITWVTGDNKDLQMEVKEHSGDKIKLFLPMPHAVKIGDTFTICAGCDGNATTCKNRFNNLINFRGEPYTPGNNYAASYPVSTSDNIVSEGESPKRAVYDWDGDFDKIKVTYRKSNGIAWWKDVKFKVSNAGSLSRYTTITWVTGSGAGTTTAIKSITDNKYINVDHSEGGKVVVGNELTLS